jgi:hypothetical protein
VKDVSVGQHVDVMMPHGYWMRGTVAKLGRKLIHVHINTGGTVRLLPGQVAPLVEEEAL